MVESRDSSAPAQLGPQEWQHWTEPGIDWGDPAWLTLALRHWRKILTLVVLGFLGGIGYLSIAPKIYLGVAQIEIEPTEKRVVRVDSITNDLGTDRSIIDGQIELMQSASLARKRCPAPTFRTDRAGGLMPTHERSI